MLELEYQNERTIFICLPFCPFDYSSDISRTVKLWSGKTTANPDKINL